MALRMSDPWPGRLDGGRPYAFERESARDIVCPMGCAPELQSFSASAGFDLPPILVSFSGVKYTSSNTSLRRTEPGNTAIIHASVTPVAWYELVLSGTKGQK